ncbi:MAG: hypothetical protein LBC85_04170 [Fibromonadaceae bacterium]|jgi:hypothetical protein|nr:hypothetical protein [Fibromonadaceae bacterium]
MSLKDEPLFENPLMMNIAVLGSIATVIVMALVFFVFAKGNYEKQAKEFVKERQERIDFQVAQINDNLKNNELLWTMIDSIWKTPDRERTIAFIKRYADSQKLPRCNGKPCTGDDARLNTTIVNNPQERSIKVGWSKYSFKVYFDSKDRNRDRFLTLNADDLLGKSQQSMEEEEEEEEE